MPPSPPHFLGGLAVRRHLAQHHTMIDAALLHEFLMRSLLDDPAVLHEENEIGAADGREAMRDHESGAASQERRHRRLDELLAFRIQIARGLIEDENLR